MRALRHSVIAVLLLALSVCAPTRAFATGLITHASAGTTSASAAVTTTAIDTTGANLIVAVVSNNFAAGQAALSDSATNTWVATTRRGTSGSGAVQIFYVSNPTTSTTHTATIAATTSNLASITFMAFKVAATSPFDVEAGSTSATSGTITPSLDGSLLVYGYQDSVSNAITAPLGWAATGGFGVIGANRYAHFAMIRFQGVAGSINTAALPNSPTNPSSTIVAFKPETGGGATATATTFVQ